MSGKRDKPMPGIVFRGMSLFFVIRDRFRKPEKLLRQTGIEEGQTVLDFGCGPGSYTIPAARMVGENGRVYALDIHPLASKAIERKARKRGIRNVTTIVSDRDTGLQDASVDVALAYDMIHMVKDKRAMLDELHRVIKPSGLLSILVDHTKVEDVLEAAEKDGLFSLRERHGKLLNLERRRPG